MIDVGLVTYDALPGGSSDDQLLVPALAAHGLQAGFVVWDDPAVDWAAPAVCVVRSTWDYFHRRAAFVAWAEQVAEQTDLWNPAPLLRWNTHKHYLADLAARGVPCVPTVWLTAGTTADLARILRERGWRQAVLKPAVSADSYGTSIVTGSALAADQARLAALLRERDMMVQPFLESVGGYGERSLMFIAGAFTHAVRRAAPQGYGDGDDAACPPVVPTADEIALAGAALDAVGAPPLYARVDLLRDDTGAPALLELELVEPSLFLRQSPPAVDRLAGAIAARVMKRQKNQDSGA
jgi:hypothetical protein